MLFRSHSRSVWGKTDVNTAGVESFCHSVDLLRDNLWKNYPQIEIVDFNFYDVNAFNQCENNNCVLMAVPKWQYVHPLLKILPVDWGYTIPYGLLHSPAPSPVVKQFLYAVEKAVRPDEI